MRGFSLMEVLVALALLSFGLLGSMGLELMLVKSTENAYYLSLANIRLASFAEQLYANKGEGFRKQEFIAWNRLNAMLIPGLQGSYICSLETCDLSLKWHDSKKHNVSLKLSL